MENKAYKNYAALAAAYVANGRKPVGGSIAVAGAPATAEIRADGSALIILKGERYELSSYLSLPSRYAGTADGRHVKAAVGAAWTRVRGHAADKAPARDRAGASGKPPSACRLVKIDIDLDQNDAAAMAAFKAALGKARKEYAAAMAAYERAAAERAAAERAAAEKRRLESLARKVLGIADKEGAELMLSALLNREGMADAAEKAASAVARVSAAAAAAEKSKEENLLLANKEEN